MDYLNKLRLIAVFIFLCISFSSEIWSQNDALFSVESNAHGIMIPSMSEDHRKAIQNPSVGLLVFQNTEPTGFCYYNGTEWVILRDAKMVDAEKKPFSDMLTDSDKDTKIQVEKSSDEDVIRFDLAGMERWKLSGNSLSPSNSGSSLFIGEMAGFNDDLSSNKNTFIGNQSGSSNTNGYFNTSLGSNSLSSNTSGYQNTALGYGGLQNAISAFNNTAIGFQSLLSNIYGSYNTAIGFRSLVNNETGNYNTAIGSEALLNNTGGMFNTAIGVKADVLLGNLVNATAIGYNAKVESSNSLVLGGTGNYAVNVGIGLTNPDAELHVIGNIKMVDGNQGIGKVLTSDGDGFATWQELPMNSPTDEIQDLNSVLTEGNDAAGLLIKNLQDPENAQDAATKKYVDNNDDVDDADNDPTNELDNTDNQSLTISGHTLQLSSDDGTDEIDLTTYLDNTDSQELSLSGTDLSIEDGNTVDLSSLQDGTGTDNQDLKLNGNTLSLTNDPSTVNLSKYYDNTDNQNLKEVLGEGNNAAGEIIKNLGEPQTPNDAATKAYVDNNDDVDDADADATNEIQTLDVSQLSGTNLELSLSSDGQATKVIDLSSLQDGTGTDDQALTLTGTTLSIEDGNSVDLSTYLDNTDSQDLSIDSSGNVFTINLTDGGLVKFEDSVDDDDADATNEIQTLDVSQLSGTNLELSLSSDGQATKSIDLSSLQDGTGTDDQALTLTGTTLSIEDGNSVNLSAYLDNTDSQELSLTGTTLSIQDGNSVDLSTLQDGTGTDDQSLALSGNSLSIEGGNSVDLSAYLDNTDSQELSLSGTTLSIEDGNAVDLSSIQDGVGTDTQDLSIDSTGNVFTINLTDGGLVKFEDSVDDADADASNEIQTLDVSQLSGTSLELSLSSDGQATKSIDLSSLQDGTGTDDQSLTLSSNTLSIEDGNSVDLSAYLDNTDSQELSLTGTTLSIADGNAVDLSSIQDGVGTDTQDLSIDSTGNVFTINLTDGGLVKFEDSVDDADADATNEIQTLDVSQLSGTNLELSLSSDGQATKSIDLSSLQDGTGTDDQSLTLTGTTLSIEDGNSVNLSAYLDNTDSQELSLTGTTLSIQDGNSVDLSAYLDNTDTQDLSLSGNTLSLTNDGTSVDLSAYLDNTDSQELSLTGTTLSIEDGNAVDLSSIQDGVGTDTQDLSIDSTGNVFTINLTDGGLVKFEDSVDDADADATNEIQTLDVSQLSGTNLELSLSSDGQATKSIDLSSLQDGTGTDDQSLTLTGTTLSIEDGNSINLSTLQDGTGTDDQSLTLSSNTLSIEDGNSVDLSAYLDNTDSQELSLMGTTLSIADGNAVDLSSIQDGVGTDTQDLTIDSTGNVFTINLTDGGLVKFEDSVDDADADASNEIQTLDVSQLTGTNLELSLSADGEATKVIDLSSLQDGTGTDDQALTLSGNSLSIEDGNSVDLSSYLDNTDTQDLSIDSSGNVFTINLTDGGLVKFEDSVDDADADASNEIQTLDVSQLTGTNLELSLSSDGQATKSIDLSSLQDGTGTDDQSLTLTGTTLSIEDGNSVNLSAYLDNTDSQELSLTGTTLSIQDGNSVDLSTLQDGTGTDDQSLTLSSNTLSIEDGNSVDLSAYLDNTDSQELSLMGTTLSIADGNAVDLSSIQDGVGTDTQDLTIDSTGNVFTINLTDGGLVKFEDSVDDADADASNEIQTLDVSQLTGTNLELSLSSDGQATKSIDLSSLQDGTGTDDQVLTLTGTTLSIEDGNSVNLSTLQDGTGTDDQSLTLSNNTLSIEDGNSVDLSAYLDNTDSQELSLTGTTLSIEDGNSVDLSSIQDGVGTDTQDLSIDSTGNVFTINLTDGGLVKFEDSVDDADADATNEIQTLDVSQLSGTNLELSLSSDGQATKSIDLSSLQDGTGTDDQSLSLSGNSLSIEDGNSVDLSSYLDNTDSQELSLSGTTLSIEDGNAVDLSSIQDGVGTDTQDLSIDSTGNVFTINLTGGGLVKFEDSVDDADADASNEIQTLDVSQLSGTNLELSLSSDGQATKSIDLSSLQDGTGTDDQDLTLTGTTLSIEDGNSVNLSTLQDGTGTDDQSLTLSSNTLSIEDGNSVDLSAYLDNTDSQELSLTGTTLSIEDGNAVDLSSIQDGVGTDTQDLSIDSTGNVFTINLTDGGLVKFEDSVDDADADATNEIQTLDVSQLTGTNLELSLSADGQATKSIDLSSLQDGTGTDDQALTLTGNSLSIEDGNSVDLSAYLDNTDAQDLSLSGNTLSLTNDGTSVDLSSYLDNTDAQDLSLTGNTLSLTNDGTSVDLSPYLDNTDSQELSLTGTTLSIEDGNAVDLSSIQDGVGTDTQDLSIDSTGNVFTINLTDGGLVKFEDSVDDADADASNEIQTLDVSQLSGTNLELSLSSDGQATKSIDLSSLQDGTGTDDQALTLTGNSLSIEDGNSVDLSAYLDNTDAQDLSLSGNTLSLTNDGTSVDLSSYLDNTDAQDLSLTGNTLSLTNDGTSVDLSPYLDNTDSQELSLTGTTLSIEDGNAVDLSSIQDGVGTDTQDLSIDSTGNVFTINLTDGGLVKFEDSVDDADADATNEIQTLDVSQLTGTNLELSLSADGQATKSIDLSSLQDGTGTDDQALTLSGTTLSIEDGNSVNLSTLQDGIGTDDQSLALSGNSLSIEDGNSVDLSAYMDNTDTQDLSLSGNTLSLTNDGTSVDLSSYLDNTDAQDLSLTGNTLSLTNDGTSVDLSPYLDNTDSQELSLTGTTLSIEDGNAVDLSSIQDGVGTDTQDLSIDSTGNVFTINLTDGGLVKFEDSVDDADADASNEIQTLDVSQLTGTNLELSLSADGQATKVIDLSSLQDGTGTDDQSLTLTGNSLSIEDGNSVDLSSYLDNTDSQDLSLSGNTLSLSNDGTSVDLSAYMDNTDTQDLSLTGNTLSLSNDASSVDLSGYLDNTDAQDLSLSGNTLSLTNDGTSVDLSGYLDNTDNQDLSLSGNTLSLTNDGTTVDLSGYLDNTDDQTLSEVLSEGNDAGASKISNLADPTLAQDAATKAYVDANDHWEDSTDDIYNSNSGNVGIGTSSPSSKLHVNGSITIGSDSNPAPVEGTIRWNSTSKNFEGFNGTIWINISTGEQSITNEQDKDFASDQNTDDYFGYAVSISGDYAIIGAYRNDDAGGDSGSAYIFMRSGSNWTEQAKLTASDAAGGDKFGISVGISGDYAIVGSREDDDGGDKSGSAYIFYRSGISWSQQAKLTATDAASGDKFGTGVAIDGDYAIVGAPEDDDGGDKTGSAYIFIRSGTSWTQQAKLNALDPGAGDRLGFAVGISGEYAIAGAYQDDDDGDKSGSAYIFFRSGTSWSQQAKLTASDADIDDEFGLSVSISGDYALVGAHQDDDAGLDSGSAYVFNRSGTSWTQQAKLTSNEAAAGDLYGRAVSISGDYIIVGAYAASGSGVSYIYSRSGTSWLETSKLVASDAASGDLFGFAVAIDGAYAIIGAYDDDSDGSCNFFNVY